MGGTPQPNVCGHGRFALVAAAYGWPADLSDEQILEKLHALKLERAEEEAKAAKVS